MGGGYPRDLDHDSAAFDDIVQCHADVYREAAAANERHARARAAARA